MGGTSPAVPSGLTKSPAVPLRPGPDATHPTSSVSTPRTFPDHWSPGSRRGYQIDRQGGRSSSPRKTLFYSRVAPRTGMHKILISTLARSQVHSHSRTRMHTHTHSHTRAHIHSHSHTRTLTHMHIHTNSRTHSHACIDTHSHTHSHMRTHTLAFTHSHTHARTLTHTHIISHSRAHTHTHAHTHVCCPLLAVQRRESTGPLWSSGRGGWRRGWPAALPTEPPLPASSPHTPGRAVLRATAPWTPLAQPRPRRPPWAWRLPHWPRSGPCPPVPVPVPSLLLPDPHCLKDRDRTAAF